MEVTDDQIAEITATIKQEIKDREEIKISEIDDNTLIVESKMKILEKDETKEKSISVFLIAETSIDSDILASLSEDDRYEWLMNLKIVHLEWLGIRKIEKLEIFTNLQVLYLQNNNISRIENLESLTGLEYLALNHNQITTICNLSHLKNLTFLNLSHNNISDLPVKELPVSLECLNLISNTQLKEQDYKKTLIEALPALEMLNEQQISTEQKFRMLGILPPSSNSEDYSEKLRKFKEEKRLRKLNNQQTEGIIGSSSSISTTTSSKGGNTLEEQRAKILQRREELLSKNKFKKVFQTEEEAIKDMDHSTKSIILKQKEKTIKAMTENLKELNEYATMHVKRLETIHESDPHKSEGQYSNILQVHNFIENRQHEIQQSEYELEKIKMQRSFFENIGQQKEQGQSSESQSVQSNSEEKESEEK